MTRRFAWVTVSGVAMLAGCMSSRDWTAKRVVDRVAAGPLTAEPIPAILREALSSSNESAIITAYPMVVEEWHGSVAHWQVDDGVLTVRSLDGDERLHNPVAPWRVRMSTSNPELIRRYHSIVELLRRQPSVAPGRLWAVLPSEDYFDPTVVVMDQGRRVFRVATDAERDSLAGFVFLENRLLLTEKAFDGEYVGDDESRTEVADSMVQAFGGLELPPGDPVVTAMLRQLYYLGMLIEVTEEIRTGHYRDGYIAPDVR